MHRLLCVNVRHIRLNHVLVDAKNVNIIYAENFNNASIGLWKLKKIEGKSFRHEVINRMYFKMTQFRSDLRDEVSPVSLPCLALLYDFDEPTCPCKPNGLHIASSACTIDIYECFIVEFMEGRRNDFIVFLVSCTFCKLIIKCRMTTFALTQPSSHY